MRLERIIILAAIAGLIFSATGCAIMGGNGDEALVEEVADDIADDVDVDSSDNPFLAPSDDGEDEDESEGEDEAETVVVDDEDESTPVEEVEAQTPEVKFVTDVEEVDSVFKAGEEKLSTPIEVTGGSGEGFTWSSQGMPAGFALVGYNSKSVQLNGSPGEGDVGEYQVTLTATDVGGDKQSAGIAFTLKVETSIEEDDAAPLPDPCSQPLKIEAVGEGRYGSALWGGVVDDDDGSDSKMAILGSKNRQMKFRVVNGKPPYTWTWTSKVERSLQCWRSGALEPGQEPYYFVSEGEECGQSAHSQYPAYAENITWRIEGVENHSVPISTSADLKRTATPWTAITHDSTVTFAGSFQYTSWRTGVAALPIIYEDGVDNLKRLPEDDFTLTVTDSCSSSARSGGDILRRRRSASYNRTFVIHHEDEKLTNASITLFYRDAATSNKKTYSASSDYEYCTVEQCDEFERANLTFFFMGSDDQTWHEDQIYIGDDYEDEDNLSGVLYYGDIRIRPSYIDDLFEHAGAYARFRMKTLVEDGNRSTKDVKQIDDDATVMDARHLFMRLDTPGKKSDGALWTDETDYDNINITKIRIDTRQWFMEMNITDASDPWAWNCGTALYDYPMLSMVAPRIEVGCGYALHAAPNSQGGIFRRKAYGIQY